MFMRKSAVINIMEKTCHEASVQLLRDFNELAYLKNNKKLDQFIEKTYVRVLNIITTNLLRSNPNHGIIYDNSITKKSSNNFYWMINPLSAKQNFIHRLPIFGMGIGLLDNNLKEINEETRDENIDKNFEQQLSAELAEEKVTRLETFVKKNVLAGMFYSPVNGELFYAEKNNGAFLNDRKLLPPTNNLISSSQAKHSMEKLTVANSLGNRNLGCFLIHMSYLAARRVDSVCESIDNIADLCIGKLLVIQARGNVAHKNGKIYASLT